MSAPTGKPWIEIKPKNCQVCIVPNGDSGFLQFFRVVSRDYGKPRALDLSFRESFGWFNWAAKTPPWSSVEIPYFDPHTL